MTLYQRRRLRGCMGRTDRSLPLAETVAQCAVTAALHDPRFRPLRAEEVEAVEIELSLLSELKAVEAAEVVAGTHGVLVVCGGCRGLLLPQVARERGWTAEVLLTEACRKAGLAPEAWRARETVIFAFSAETVSEGAALAGSEQRYSTST